MILMPLYWQQIRHESVVDTGLLTAPRASAWRSSMPFAGRLADRFGGGPLALVGVIVTTLATIPFGFIGADTSIVGLSMRDVRCAEWASASRSCRRWPRHSPSLRPSELADATPQLNVLQRVGGSIGTAVLAVVLQRALTGAHGIADAAGAYGTAFWWSLGLTALAIVPCIVLVRAERAARRERGSLDPGVTEEAVAESLGCRTRGAHAWGAGARWGGLRRAVTRAPGR